MPALLRVRVPEEVKERLEALAAALDTDVSDLVRQALYAKYPQLKAHDAEADSFSETPAEYGGQDGLVEAIKSALAPFVSAVMENSKITRIAAEERRATQQVKEDRRAS